ncbi:MAG: response regulator [Lysinibacillus sp.]
MKIIMVDDESLPLARLKKLLLNSDIEGIEIVGEYMNPLKALEDIQILQPDVVFLDIEMPGLNGLVLGEKIQEILPNTQIAFVTGFDQYAIEAFNIHAIDYLLKPVQKERLLKTLHRLQKNFGEQPAKLKHSISIELFGGIRGVLADGQVKMMKWRTAKAKELFAYMMYRHDEIIYRDTILDLLWPDSDIEKATKQLYTTIYTIRQTLKKYGLTSINISSPLFDSGYKLTIDHVRIDVEDWLEQLKALQPLQPNTLAAHEHVFHAYKGRYLGEQDYIWAGSESERLKRLWLHHGQQLSEFYKNEQNYDAAIKTEEKRQSIHPEEEGSYFTLMKLYHMLNNAVAVEEQYLRLKNMLQEKFEVGPSVEIEEWYSDWAMSQVGVLG